MTLDEAIHILKEITPKDDPWCTQDLEAGISDMFQVDQAIAVILNAVVSGELKK